MKNTFLFYALFVFCRYQAIAQSCDTLLLRDGNKLTVSEITVKGAEIYYERCPPDSSGSSLRMILDQSVQQIRYASGSTRQFVLKKGQQVLTPKPNPGPNDLYAGIGFFSSFRTLILLKAKTRLLGLGPIFFKDEEHHKGTPILILGYQRYVAPFFAIGLETTFERFHVQGVYAQEKYDVTFHMSSYRASFRGVWRKTEDYLFYSGVSIGVSYVKASGHLVSDFQTLDGFHPGYSFIPFGVQINRPTGMNVEFGWGWAGLLNISLHQAF